MNANNVENLKKCEKMQNMLLIQTKQKTKK